MSGAEWTFTYSSNMPTHPRSVDNGWQFDFPNRNGVGYLVTTQRVASASQSMRVSIDIETTGDPFFEYRTESSNTCETPAAVRLFFQRRGDDMSGSGQFEFYRWWSNPVAHRLRSGHVDLVGDLTDASQWTSVYGKSGAANEQAFRAALADLGNLGFTFGGGCFFGHGVFVAPGTGQAVFTATDFVVR